jgi:hypothetical protein
LTALPATLAAQPVPDPAAVATKVPDDISGAEAFKHAVTQQSDTVGGFISWLDAFGFTVGDTRISAWSLLVVVVVIVGLFLFARIGSKIAHRLFKRFTALDASARVLGEKLLSILIWTFAILIGTDILGIDLTALAVFSGAFGLAIGFGLQKTFGNLLAGIILLMDRSIKPGDVIAINDGSATRWTGQEDRPARGLGDHARQEGIPDPEREPDDQSGRELVRTARAMCESGCRSLFLPAPTSRSPSG